MPAYVISEVEFLDAAAVEHYRELARRSIEQHGGRYLVRGATPRASEGEWPAQRRTVIVEFPDMTAARGWYASPEYAEALAFRDRALTRRLVFVDGA
ncbi:MAG: DUF1330 domain-containing protein [Mycobacteriaceae bacterium]|nr:DUF1330 domain-containing protein [Mycobacteriaceae bacterium]